MQLDFIITGTPKPQSRPKFFRNRAGYMGTYSPKTDWFNIVYSEILKQKEEFYKGIKLKGEIEIHINFFMPIPSSLSNKKKKQLELNYHTKKPDIDNLIKAVLDAINYTNLWEDDSHIWKIVSEKRYSACPQCVITIITSEE